MPLAPSDDMTVLGVGAGSHVPFARTLRPGARFWGVWKGRLRKACLSWSFMFSAMWAQMLGSAIFVDLEAAEYLASEGLDGIR